MKNPFELSKQITRGGSASTIVTQPFFNRQPDMPVVKCRNFGKASHEDWCDEDTHDGFVVCDGCRDKLRGEL